MVYILLKLDYTSVKCIVFISSMKCVKKKEKPTTLLIRANDYVEYVDFQKFAKTISSH